MEVEEIEEGKADQRSHRQHAGECGDRAERPARKARDEIRRAPGQRCDQTPNGRTHALLSIVVLTI